MAETATRPYNLRSREEVVELPLQLQLLDVTIFMSYLQASDRILTGQISDSESSINDSDYGALVSSPNFKSNSSPGVILTNNKLNSDPIGSHSDSVSQRVIKMQILSQLQALDRRFHMLKLIAKIN